MMNFLVLSNPSSALDRLGTADSGILFSLPTIFPSACHMAPSTQVQVCESLVGHPAIIPGMNDRHSM